VPYRRRKLTFAISFPDEFLLLLLLTLKVTQGRRDCRILIGYV